MTLDLIKDKLGKVPNYIIFGDWMCHQPTGLQVLLEDKLPKTLRKAQLKLKQLIKDRSDG